MIFTNKHVIVAMLVAPVLAVLAWLAVGQIAAEKPRSALSGQSYPLLEKSNCRYESGRCDLENEHFKLALRVERGVDLSIQSAHSLQGILVSVGLPEQDIAPQAMTAADATGTTWHYRLEDVPGADDRIRLVAATRQNVWFGDAATVFIQP